MHILVVPIFWPPSRVIDDSHNPAFIVGKSIASALVAPSDNAMTMEAGKGNLMACLRSREKRKKGSIVDRCRPRVNEISSDGVQIHVFVDRHAFEDLLVEARCEDRLLLLGGEPPRQVRAELFNQQRNAFLAAAHVADRILNSHFLQ